jgi:hypothetical protein
VLGGLTDSLALFATTTTRLHSACRRTISQAFRIIVKVVFFKKLRSRGIRKHQLELFAAIVDLKSFDRDRSLDAVRLAQENSKSLDDLNNKR